MNGRSSLLAPRVSVDAASTRSRSAALPGLRITDVSYGPGFTATRHEHEHDCVTLVLEGAVAKELRARERTLGIGAVATTPAAAPHADRFGARGGRVLVLELLQRAEGLPRTSRPSDSTRTESLRLVWLGRRLAAELVAADDAAPLALHAAALELLAIVSRSRPTSSRAPQRWLDDVLDHLNAHVFERVTLAELAAVGGVHRAHLVRSFQARFGLSVGAYVRRAGDRRAGRFRRPEPLHAHVRPARRPSPGPLPSYGRELSAWRPAVGDARAAHRRRHGCRVRQV